MLAVEAVRSHPKKPGGYLAFGVATALLALVLIPVFWAVKSGQPDTVAAMWVRLITFFGTFLALLGILVGVGAGVTGQRMGVLWTARNTYSLSRLQIVLWTLLVLSALAAVVACRVHGLVIPHGSGAVLADPLNISIPGELLAVMGISVLSAAAAPAILTVKAQSESPRVDQLDAAAARVGREVETVGQVAVRPTGYPPLIRDLFQGDDVAKTGTVDIGKVQQAAVTLVLWGAYFSLLVQLFVQGRADARGMTHLPALSETFVYLLGISHVGYLAYKATPATAPGHLGATPPPASAASLPRPVPPVI